MQGLGLEFVRQLLRKGNTVIAAARAPQSAPGLVALASELAAEAATTQQGTPPAQLYITTLDVADASSITAWATGLRAACPGLRHVDVVISNAGVYGRKLDIDSVNSEDMVCELQ
jgi:NAD(P)-dependent dehydrogenase (short-subunit alcohol dehydrogenase family)